MNLKRLAHIRSKESFTDFINRFHAGSVDDFYQELNRESDRLIRTDLKQAQKLTQATARLEAFLPPVYRAHLFRIWGRHHHLSGDFRQAERLYRKAMAIFHKLGDANSCARVEKAMLDVLMYLAEYDRAVQIGRKALRYYRSVGAIGDYAQVLSNLGNLYHRLDQNKKALSYYDRAYQIFKNLNHAYALAVIQFNRGNIYSNLNELKEADALYRQSAAIYRSLGMELAAGQADYSLAYIAFLQGAYSDALSAFTKVGDDFRRLGDQRMLALTELDRTEVNLHLNLYSQAIDDARHVAGEFRRLRMAYEQAKAYYFAAAGYFAYGDFALTVKYARKAHAMFVRENNQVWQVLCRFLLARVDCQEERLTEALTTFREIARFYQRQGNTRSYQDVRLAWLEALMSAKRFRVATVLAKGIKKSWPQLAGYQKFLYHLLIGDMHRMQGTLDVAARSYRCAVTEAEKLTATIFPDEIRRFFWLDKLSACNRLAEIHLQTGRQEQAFAVLEKGKTFAGVASYQTAERVPAKPIPPRLEAERNRLRTLLRKMVLPVDSAARGAGAAGALHAAEERLWKIERSLREEGYSRLWNETTTACTVESVQERLAPSESLVQYVCRGDLFGAFVISPHHFVFTSFDTPTEEVRTLLARLYFLVNRSGGYPEDEQIIRNLLSRLSRVVWQPLAELVGRSSRLFLVPDGVLTRVPFAVIDGEAGVLLTEQFDTCLLTSVSAFVSSTADVPIRRLPETVTVVSASDPMLPGAARENEVILNYFPQAQAFIGREATIAHVLESLAVPDSLVHMAAHAAQSYENDLFSRIVLADGPLYPFDLMMRPIRARLVVLSACQTGDPGLYYRSDTLSLAQAFLQAGASGVVASYWPVSDEITCLFMDMFYRHWSLAGNPSAALTATRAEMRALAHDFRHWAAFYLLCR